MWAVAFGALDAMGTTCECGVSPLPAFAALGNTRVHISSSDSGDVLAKVEGMVDEGLCVGAVLRIPNVHPYDGHV